jgi:hypothetical protein
VAGFFFDLIDLEGDALDGVLTGKAAVGAGVDALVREVERGEESHRSAEMPTGGGGGAGGETLERGVVHGLQQCLESPQERGFLAERIVEYFGKTHQMIRAERLRHLFAEPGDSARGEFDWRKKAAKSA